MKKKTGAITAAAAAALMIGLGVAPAQAATCNDGNLCSYNDTKYGGTTWQGGSGDMATSMAASAAGVAPSDDPLDALVNVAPEVVAESVELSDTSSDTLTATNSNGSTEVPTSSNGAVQLSSNGVTLQIRRPIPNAEVVSHSDGVAVFSTEDSVSTVVSPQSESGVVIATVLHDETAQTRYDYGYAGLRLELTGEGDAIGYDSNGQIAALIAIPWAYDAAGKPVPTHYEVNGSTLTQIVDHVDGGYSYPIVADPFSYGGNDLYTDIQQDQDSRGYLIRVYAAPVNFGQLSNSIIWTKYQSIVPNAWETTTMYDQLICHVRNIGRLKQPWNLEPWRPNVGYVAVVAAGCNPQ